jgi:hypothetical protein
MRTALPAVVAVLAFFGAAALIGLGLGESYIGRLSNHAGYFLVAVNDEVQGPTPPRPRRAFFILVDGLRRDSAETMVSTRRLERAGQCRISDQGSYTVSRPVYALLSTGLEVDRHGSRNNEETSPLAAESIWEIARESGLRVAGSSHLPWFRQLFPRGFDRFDVAESHAANVFQAGELLDVNLFHPLYVDDAGHHHGGASVEYAAALARADREIEQLLDRIDLSQDLVALTADHGHRDEGGHGGAQPDVRQVLTCFAGPNVARRSDRASLDGRVTAPALALLLGLRFPRHMRAGEDGLDALWEIGAPEKLGERYLADRHAAVGRFREANRAALEGWVGLPGKGTWDQLYAQAERPQTFRLVLVTIAALVILAVRARRRPLQTLGYVAGAALALYLAHRIALGVFDYTVVNRRERFIALALAAAVSSALVVTVAHARIVRSREHLTEEMVTGVALLLLANLGHIFVYGWPLGFPLPPPALRYAPFYGAITLVGFALVALAANVLPRFLRRTERAASRPSTDR